MGGSCLSGRWRQSVRPTLPSWGPGLAPYYGPRLGKCPFPSEPGVSRSCPPAPHKGMHGQGQKLPLAQPRAEPKARGGGPPAPLSAAPGSLAGGRRVRRRRARCSAGEGASLSSWAAISHAVHTPNLKGPWLPASGRERASGLLFLMHTVKGREITVIHLLGASGCRNLLSMCP